MGSRQGYPGHRVVLVGVAPALTGGIAAVVRAILASSLKGRYEFLVVPSKEFEPRSRGACAKALRLARFGTRLIGALARFHPGLVHFHASEAGSFWPSAIAAVACRCAGTPYVWHIHGGSFDQYVRHHRGPGLWALRRVLAHASATVVLSEQWRRTLEPLLPGAALRVVRNGVAVPPPPTRSRDGWPVVCLCVSMVGRAKGTYDLIAAAESTASAGACVRFVLAGGEQWGGEWDSVARRAGTSAARDRIELLGAVPPSSVAQLLERAGIFVLPSHSEAMPVSILEAMAAGLPVIATRVGAIPEVATAEGFILIEPGDVAALAAAIEELVADPGRRVRMGSANRARVEQEYSVERMAEDLDRVYQEALAGGRRGRRPQ